MTAGTGQIAAYIDSTMAHFLLADTCIRRHRGIFLGDLLELWPELPALEFAAVRTTHTPAGSSHCAARAARITVGAAGFQCPPCHLETGVRLCKVPFSTTSAQWGGLHCRWSQFLRVVSLMSISLCPHALYPSMDSGRGSSWVIFLPFPSLLAV